MLVVSMSGFGRHKIYNSQCLIQTFDIIALFQSMSSEAPKLKKCLQNRQICFRFEDPLITLHIAPRKIPDVHP